MDTKDQAAAGQEQAGPDSIRQEPIAKQAGVGDAGDGSPAGSDAPVVSKAPPTHDELVEQVIDTIVTEGMIDREKVTPDATIESLDLKSIDIVMILTALEDKFDVYIPMDGPFHDAKNVKDLIEAIATYIMKEKQA